jgi:hypothetical protein
MVWNFRDTSTVTVASLAGSGAVEMVQPGGGGGGGGDGVTAWAEQLMTPTATTATGASRPASRRQAPADRTLFALEFNPVIPDLILVWCRNKPE